VNKRHRHVSLWAPLADKVEIELNGHRQPLEPVPTDWFAGEPFTTGEDRSPKGWFYYSLPQPEGPVDYYFRINGSDPRPDPRSKHQPEGVMGPSRLIDHKQFPWTDLNWNPPPLSSALIYELHIGTFTPEGTFESAIKRLDYLVELGVTHVELMPVAEFPGNYGWGYDGVDIFAPHHAYGGPIKLKRLVNACHERGLAVLLDVVYNHFGPVGSFWGEFAPYFTDKINTDWGSAINYGEENSDEVRRFMIDNAIMWLRDYHFDGLRLDAIQAIFDLSALHILEQLADEVRALEGSLGRHLVIIAESDLNDPRIVQPRAVGGYGLDAHWNDDFHHALHALLTGQRNGYYAGYGSIGTLARALRHAYVFAGTFSPHRRRRHGRPVPDIPGHRFLAYAQTHDQIANQPNGARISHLLSVDEVKVAAGLVLTSPFVPMLFQGEEWGASSPFPYFVDYHTDIVDSIRKGRTDECGRYGIPPESVPDPADVKTFESAKLNWDELQRDPHAQLLEWFKSLIRLRRTYAVLADGRMDHVCTEFSERERWLVIRRRPITIAVNFDAAPRQIPLEKTLNVKIILASHNGCRITSDGIKMTSHSIAILLQQRGIDTQLESEPE